MFCENMYMPVNLLTDTGHADTCQADFPQNPAAFQPTLGSLPEGWLWTEDPGLPRRQVRRHKSGGGYPHSHFFKQYVATLSRHLNFCLSIPIRKIF